MYEGKEPIMKLRNITKRFGAVVALRKVNFEVYPGECVGLVGDNGAGKSTLAKIMVGFHQPDEGEIYFEGRRVFFRSPADARALGIEIVYQDYALADHMSIYRNFFLGKELVKKVGPFKFLDKKKMKEIAESYLKDIGIRVRSVDEPVGILSGGERQSIAIARAVFFGAKLLILDEPTTSLSFKEAAKVLSFIKELKKKGLAIVMISHNIYHVYEVADRFTILDRGVKIADYLYKKDVTPEEIIDIIVKGRARR